MQRAAEHQEALPERLQERRGCHSCGSLSQDHKDRSRQHLVAIQGKDKKIRFVCCYPSPHRRGVNGYHIFFWGGGGGIKMVWGDRQVKEGTIKVKWKARYVRYLCK